MEEPRKYGAKERKPDAQAPWAPGSIPGEHQHGQIRGDGKRPRGRRRLRGARPSRWLLTATGDDGIGPRGRLHNLLSVLKPTDLCVFSNGEFCDNSCIIPKNKEKKQQNKTPPSPACREKTNRRLEKRGCPCASWAAGVSPGARPPWTGRGLHADPPPACCPPPTLVPPRRSAPSSLPDKTAVVDAGHVLGKDARVAASAASCHPSAAPGCASPGQRRGARRGLPAGPLPPSEPAHLCGGEVGR